MVSMLATDLAQEFDDFVKKELATLRQRVSAEHKRQVAWLVGDPGSEAYRAEYALPGKKGCGIAEDAETTTSRSSTQAAVAAASDHAEPKSIAAARESAAEPENAVRPCAVDSVKEAISHDRTASVPRPPTDIAFVHTNSLPSAVHDPQFAMEVLRERTSPSPGDEDASPRSITRSDAVPISEIDDVAAPQLSSRGKWATAARSMKSMRVVGAISSDKSAVVSSGGAGLKRVSHAHFALSSQPSGRFRRERLASGNSFAEAQKQLSRRPTGSRVDKSDDSPGQRHSRSRIRSIGEEGSVESDASAVDQMPLSPDAKLEDDTSPEMSCDVHTTEEEAEDEDGRGMDVAFEPLPVWSWTFDWGRSHTAMSFAAIQPGLRSKKGHIQEEDAAEVRISTTMPKKFTWDDIVLHPSHRCHIVWQLVALVLVAYDLVTVPMQVFSPPDSRFGTAMRWTTLIFWTANIFLSFFTGYLTEDGTVEMSLVKIQLRYLFTWFPIDFIVVAVDWVEVLVADLLFPGASDRGFATVLRTMRTLRAARLMRLLKMSQVFSAFKEHIRSESVLLLAKMLRSILAMLAIAHVSACAWFGIGKVSAGLHRDSWIKEASVEDSNLGIQYTLAFHWALSQLSGEQILHPTNTWERGFVIFVVFATLLIAASFVSSLTTAMTRLEIISGEQSSQMATLRHYLADQGIDRALAVRVLRNAQHALNEERRFVPESRVGLLKLISTPLLIELHFEIHSQVLGHHPFVSKYQEVNPAGVKKVCHSAELEAAMDKMFFIVQGSLTYQHKLASSSVSREKPDRNIGAGPGVQLADSGVVVTRPRWLCEPVLWTVWRHCGTARAVAEGRLVVVSAERFQESICDFPSDHARQYAEGFVHHLNTIGPGLQTDLPLPQDAEEQIIEEAFPEDDTSSSEESSVTSEAEEDVPEKPHKKSFDRNASTRLSMISSGSAFDTNRRSVPGSIALRKKGWRKLIQQACRRCLRTLGCHAKTNRRSSKGLSLRVKDAHDAAGVVCTAVAPRD